MSFDELLQSTDIALLESEYKKRQGLQSQMVGLLYPSILAGEMIQIQRRISTLRYSPSNKEYTMQFVLLPSTARKTAETILTNISEAIAPGGSGSTPPFGVSDWELIAELVSLLQSERYKHLKGKVSFVRKDGVYGEIVASYPVERMKSCIENDIEVRPQQ